MPIGIALFAFPTFLALQDRDDSQIALNRHTVRRIYDATQRRALALPQYEPAMPPWRVILRCSPSERHLHVD